MGVRSVPGQELNALVTASEARTPRAQPGAKSDPPVAPQESHIQGKPDKPAVTPTSQETLAKAAQAMNHALATGVRFHIDKSSSRIVAQIVDANNKVIKQIPPEELLRIADQMRKLEGILFDKKA